MKNMTDTFAPIMIATLCRYEHFKCCIESLVRNTYADQTELYIGLDYPLKESHWEGYRKTRHPLFHHQVLEKEATLCCSKTVDYKSKEGIPCNAVNFGVS